MSRNGFRACLLTASLFLVPCAFADLFEPDPFVPPADSVYTVANTCVSVLCLENITISNFTNITSQIVGGNQLTKADVSLNASAFQNTSPGTPPGTPGNFIGPIQLNGEMDVTYFNKTTASEFGTFSDKITFLDLSGTFHGLTGTHTITATLNPNEASTGQTTVTRIGTEPPEFRISSFFDVFAEISIDGGPFVPGPGRVAQLGETPEPAYYGAVGILLAAMLVRRVFKPKSSGAQSEV